MGRTHGVDVPFPQVFPADETPIFVYSIHHLHSTGIVFIQTVSPIKLLCSLDVVLLSSEQAILCSTPFMKQLTCYVTCLLTYYIVRHFSPIELLYSRALI